MKSPTEFLRPTDCIPVCYWRCVPPLVSLVVGLSIVGVCRADSIAVAPVVDLATLRSDVLRIHDAIKCLDVTYQLNADVEGDNLSTGRVSTHHLVVRDAVRLRENIHGRTPESIFLDKDHGIQMWCPSQMATYEVNNRVLKIASAKYASPYSWKVRYDRFMIYIGWWPAADRVEPPASRKRIHVHLRHILASNDYRLRSAHEVVDGEACVVLENSDSSDILWLDPRLGYAIRRRSTLDSETRQILEDYTCRQFASYSVVADDSLLRVWVPSRIDVATSVGIDSVATSRSVMTVKKVSFDQVGTGGIDFDPAAGTLIWDMDTGTTLATAGGIDLLDENVDRARKLESAGTIRTPTFESTYLRTYRRQIETLLWWLNLSANTSILMTAILIVKQYARRPVQTRLSAV